MEGPQTARPSTVSVQSDVAKAYARTMIYYWFNVTERDGRKDGFKHQQRSIIATGEASALRSGRPGTRF